MHTLRISRLRFVAFQTNDRRARQVLAGAFARKLDDGPLRIFWADTKLAPNFVAGDNRPPRKVPCDIGVFARSGHSGHDDGFTAKVFVRQVIGIAALALEILKAGVCRGKSVRGVKAAFVTSKLAKEPDGVQYSALVDARASARIGRGEERKMIAAGDDAHRERHAAASPRSTAKNGI